MIGARFLGFLVAVCGVFKTDDWVELTDWGDGVCGAGAGGEVHDVWAHRPQTALTAMRWRSHGPTLGASANVPCEPFAYDIVAIRDLAIRRCANLPIRDLVIVASPRCASSPIRAIPTVATDVRALGELSR